MKADWNDAPEYMTRPPRRSGKLTKLIPGLIGTIVTLAVLQMAGSAFLQGTAQSIAAKRIQPKPSPVAEISRAEPVASRDWDKVVEEVANRGVMSPPEPAQPQASTAVSAKQTIFNDNNYIPQGATNIVPAARPAPERTTTIASSRKEIVVVGKDSRISDFCPGPIGSIERRNCKASVNLNTRN